jgi:hypothetical protein
MAIRSRQIIVFPSVLKRQIGRKRLNVWDGVGSHESRRVHA